MATMATCEKHNSTYNAEIFAMCPTCEREQVSWPSTAATDELQVAQDPDSNSDDLGKLASSENNEVLLAVIENPRTPAWAVARARRRAGLDDSAVASPLSQTSSGTAAAAPPSGVPSRAPSSGLLAVAFEAEGAARGAVVVTNIIGALGILGGVIMIIVGLANNCGNPYSGCRGAEAAVKIGQIAAGLVGVLFWVWVIAVVGMFAARVKLAAAAAREPR